MSSKDEEDKIERSIKFCQLIYERNIDSTISYEIRKLLEQGVLIDFQDQNRNKKTVIHLAVEKCDVICVKFLLQFRPNLEVRDKDEKTPVELAESSGFQNIRNALLNSAFDVVNKSFVEVIGFESLTRQRIEAIKSRASFKVLKLINCPSFNEVWEKLDEHGYTTTLKEASHLFFIAIEAKESNIPNDHELMKKFLNLRRPLIVQLTCSASQITNIYFKDDEDLDFVEVTDTPQITQEAFNEAVESDDECNLKLLLAALRANLFVRFTGDLLGTKLNTNEERSEAVNQFARSNVLCHRFFKLFDEGPTQIDRIISALSFKDDQSLLALLDLPLKDVKLKLNENQQDILSFVDSSGCNLLMMTVEQRNLDAVKLLLRCGCDFNHSDKYDKRASDICWEMHAFDYLAELIEAGSPYPSNFCIDEVDELSKAHEKVIKMVETINSFHADIRDGKIEEVKKFISSHPHINHAFDTNNKCALTVALQSNQVDIYSLLMSEGFESGADDKYQIACSKSKYKDEIRNSHRKYFKEAFDEPHLKRLSEKSKLSLGPKDRAKCSSIIRKMFDELNQIDELIPILQIDSLSDKLRIAFDFNCDSVVEMDPTKESSTLGAVYPSDGFIYVGAQNHKTEFYQVIGNLIHELTHYAMKLTYENSCKPYGFGDIASTQLFEDITKETRKICDETPSTDPIVTIVFPLYSEEVRHQELIVRVTHLLAHYKLNPQALEAAERNTPELFHFYREKTLKDVETQSKVLLQRHLVSKINNQTGIAQKIQNMNVKFENVVIDLKSSVYVITSNAPQLTLALLSQAFSSHSHIFVTLEQVAIANILEKIAKVSAKESSTALIVDCIGWAQKYQECLRKFLRNIENMKTIALVMAETESTKVKENLPEIEPKTFAHKWSELTESSKVHLLGQNVIFQGVEMKLSELVEPSSDVMNFFPLSEIVDCKDFKIGHELHRTLHKFYIPRKFIKKGQERSMRIPEEAKSFKELLLSESRTNAMIISDEAGSGKSVTLSEIAKSLNVAFPDRWGLLVDLKRHIAAFKSIENYEKIESFEDFIEQNFLKNSPKFDQELFKQMFRARKTFILFDGFDEISPNYKDLLLHVLKLFEHRSGNRLFITTRPHLEDDLERVLGSFTLKLEEFSGETKTSFLREYWQSIKFEINQEDFEVLSNRLLEKFSKISASELIGLPLLMSTTAEIFEESSKENLLHKVDSLSVSSVFQKFVEKYLARWLNNENEIAQKETVEFVMAGGGAMEVHHNIAINQIFGEDVLSFDIDESDAEKISRVGLIRYDRTEKTFQFVHETFAEYFVADFIWFHLKRKNRNPAHECSKAIQSLCEVLVSYDFKTKVIRNFLDQALVATKFSPREDVCKSVANRLSEILKIRNRFDLLGRNVDASRENLASLLLAIIRHIEKDVLLKVLQPRACSVDSILLDTAAFMSSSTVSTLCDIITTCTDHPKEIYLDLGYYSRNVLSRAAVNKNGSILTALCAHLNSFLTKDEIKTMLHQKGAYGQNLITIASDNSNDELISLLPNYLSPGEIKSLLQAVDGSNNNFFHRALSNNTNGNLKLKFDVVKSNFDIYQQKAFFYETATAQNMFQYAARNRNQKIFETIIKSTREVLSNDDIKSMLMQKDYRGLNVLHYLANDGNVVILNELNSLLRERLSDDEIRSLLLEVNEKGKNCFRLAADNIRMGLQVFCDTIGNLVSLEDQTRLLQASSHEIDIISLACGNNTPVVNDEAIRYLLMKENHGRNAFHEVARGGNVDTWNKLISFAQARFAADEMKIFLFCCDINGENCLHLAIFGSSKVNMIEAVCKTIKSVGWSVEDQKTFFQKKDSRNKNVFHHAATCFHRDKCFSLLHSLSTILSKDEIKEMLKEKDCRGNNFLFYNLVSCDLMPFLQEAFTSDEMKSLLFEVDREGRNFFHCTVERSSKSEIISLSKAIKAILNQDERKKFFGNESRNVFHLAAKNPNSGIFSLPHTSA